MHYWKSSLIKITGITLALVGLFAVLPAGSFAAEDEDGFDVGGALRFNYRYMDWEDEDYARLNSALGGELLLDTYRINVDGSYNDVDLSLEYRFYAGYHMLHHGYMGYDFDEKNRVLIGVHQVPFNIQPYASHNWFFSLAYYLGLEDDYDAGIQFIHQQDNWNLKLAYYKGDEGNYTGASDYSSRYSYDIVDETFFGMQSNNREAHQFNARFAYTLQHDDLGSTELGVWGQYGMLFNEALDRVERAADPAALYTGDTDAWGDHMAVGGHLNGTYGNFNIMAYGLYVEHNPKTVVESEITAAGEDELAPDFGEDIVVFGAYDFPYTVASKGMLVAVEPAYTVSVDWGPISSLQFYNDFSMYMKDNDAYEDSYHNITGCLITAGSIYTYVDVAQGKNNPWLGEFSGLGAGVPDAEWKMRFNINMGYYF